MIWIGISIVCLGLLLGLRHRVPALVVISVVMAVGCLGAGVALGWSVAAAAGIVVAALACLQTGYLVGLLLAYLPAVATARGQQARLTGLPGSAGAGDKIAAATPADRRLGRHDV